MSLVIDATGSVGADMFAIVERDSERVRVEHGWQQSLGRYFWRGTAGLVQVEKEQTSEQFILRVSNHVLRRFGSSPMFRDERGLEQTSREGAPEPIRVSKRHAVLRMSPAEQALEVLAALSLNKSLLAEVVGVSRPTLYDWLDGKEPSVANARRLTSLAQLLANAGVTAADALSPRLVRESLNDGEPSLLELLKADALDEERVARVLAEAKSLKDEADSARIAREDRLRSLGFEEPTAEERKSNLALNIALRDWPQG
jgi:hypothetical protein